MSLRYPHISGLSKAHSITLGKKKTTGNLKIKGNN